MVWKTGGKPAWVITKSPSRRIACVVLRGFALRTAYTTSVENAMGIQVPERANVRAILLEVERLHRICSTFARPVTTGFDSGFMQFFRRA